MELLGNTALAAAVVATGAAGWAALRSARPVTGPVGRFARNAAGYRDLSLAALCVAAAMCLLALAALLVSVFFDDFYLVAIQRSSSRTLPPIYKLSVLWVNLRTSLLFWAAIQAWCAYFGALWIMRRHERLFGWTVFFLTVLSLFFLAIVVLRHNPFDVFLLEKPLFGGGMNPLLRNPWMASHPPTQYFGYISAALPFAITLASFIEYGNRASAAQSERGGSPARIAMDGRWIRALRLPMLFCWLFLGLGMVLGMLWAYEETVWGGYWSWDPVENASLMPFLTATAALHVFSRCRRSRFFAWSAVVLFYATFWLTITGTFLTRTGVLESIHTFGRNPYLAWAFTGLILIGLAVTILVTWRCKGFVARTEKSGEGAPKTGFSLNTLASWAITTSVILLGAGAFYMVFATVLGIFWPLFADHALALSPGVFERVLVPLGLLMGIAAAIGMPAAISGFSSGKTKSSSEGDKAGEQSSGGNGRKRTNGISGSVKIFLPVVLSLGAVLVTAAFGGLGRIGISGFWGVSGFAVSIVMATGTVMFLLKTNLCAKNLRIGAVHLGLALVFAGFSARSGLRQETFSLEAGEVFALEDLEFTFTGVSYSPTLTTDEFEATLHVGGRNAHLGTLSPRMTMFPDTPGTPAGRSALKRSLSRDIQVRLRSVSEDGQAHFEVVLHPLAVLIWLGFCLMLPAAVPLFPTSSGKNRENGCKTRRWKRSLLLFSATSVIWVAVVWAILVFLQGKTPVSLASMGTAVVSLALPAAALSLFGAARTAGRERG